MTKLNLIYTFNNNNNNIIIINISMNMYMGEGNSSYFPSSQVYVLVERALPHSLAQDLSFHTVR